MEQGAKVTYYNENDRKKAAWLRQLIKEGLIAPGYVDERSIEEIQPNDLEGYEHCHFFAGIGGWDHALQLAGWTGPVWTGSCPCQPLSCAGQGKGHADPRHLWPYFYRLISECKPSTVFGEQVASKLGREWLAGVRTDLEGMGYACGAADLCAASVGAPHIRQRLYWVADSTFGRINKRQETERQTESTGTSENGGLADPEYTNRGTEHQEHGESHRRNGSGRCGDIGRMRYTNNTECEAIERASGESGRLEHSTLSKETRLRSQQEHLSGQANFWSDAIWHQCRDGKSRRISPEPSLFPLANGIRGRVGILRGAGDAIVPQVAAHFIKAYITT